MYSIVCNISVDEELFPRPSRRVLLAQFYGNVHRSHGLVLCTLVALHKLSRSIFVGEFQTCDADTQVDDVNPESH